MTKQERLLGQTIIDCANAENTDEAICRFFENVQRIFDFSPIFTEEAKEKFPSATFDEAENEILSVLPTLKPVLDLLGLRKEICDYNPRSGILTVRDLRLKKSTDGMGYVVEGSKSYDMSTRDFENEFDAKLTPEINESITKLVELKHKLRKAKHNAKGSMPSSLLNRLVYDFPLRTHFKSEDIAAMARNYETVISVHRNISGLQQEIKELIEKTLRGDLRIEDETSDERLNIFLSIYNSEKMTRMVFDEKGSLIEVPNFNEQDFLDMEDAIDWYNISATYGHFERLLGYCFIGFMKSEENKAHLGKCLNCQKYYIATKLNTKNPQKFCRYSGDGCKNDWHNREKVKSGKAAKYIRNGRAEGKYQ